jgi:hypothetical protein
MALANEIRKELSRYLEGKLSLPEFQEWFDLALERSDRDEAGLRLGTAIEWAFHLFEKGRLTTETLRQKLGRLASETSGSPEIAQTMVSVTVASMTSSGSEGIASNNASPTFWQPSSGSHRYCGAGIS